MCKRVGKLFDCIQEILITVFVLLPIHKELWCIYFYICIYSKYYFQKILVFDKSFSFFPLFLIFIFLSGCRFFFSFFFLKKGEFS